MKEDFKDKISQIIEIANMRGFSIKIKILEDEDIEIEISDINN